MYKKEKASSTNLYLQHTDPVKLQGQFLAVEFNNCMQKQKSDDEMYQDEVEKPKTDLQ